MSGDSRRFPRTPAELPVALTVGDARSIRGVIRNLSILGMYVHCKELLPDGTGCEAAFEIEPMKRVRAKCSVIHRYSDGIGMEFTGIENASFEYLRAFLVAQAEDPQSCEDEILANMGNLPALY